jgi:hypothetical protein
MPVPDDSASFVHHGRRGADPDQHNCGRHDHKWHYRVHCDAELAMIGVTFDRMHMRHLGHCQQRH